VVLNFRRGSAFASKKAREILKDLNPIDIKKITVIRHAAIGDFMVMRPFLIELKKFFPNAKITLSVLRTAMYGIPKDLIDDIHIMDKDNPNNKSKKTNLISRIKQAKTLPPQDMIFDLTDSSLTLLLTFFSKAKLKIGFSYRSFRRWFYDIATLRSDFVYEAESLIHMINILGSKAIFPFSFGYEEKYPKNVQKQIVYFAGASTKNKCWEEKKYNKLIKLMHKKYPTYQHIILQGINNDEKFLNIYQGFENEKNITLQTPMKLDDTMQFLANSSLVISNDTGIRNMAIGVETPTIGIFFATGAFRYWPRDGKNECVFNENYTSPDVNEVYQTCIKLMDKLYG
jgi:ADP-heptose:LPS heptosyltransferase